MRPTYHLQSQPGSGRTYCGRPIEPMRAILVHQSQRAEVWGERPVVFIGQTTSRHVLAYYVLCRICRQGAERSSLKDERERLEGSPGAGDRS